MNVLLYLAKSRHPLKASGSRNQFSVLQQIYPIPCCPGYCLGIALPPTRSFSKSWMLRPHPDPGVQNLHSNQILGHLTLYKIWRSGLHLACFLTSEMHTPAGTVDVGVNLLLKSILPQVNDLICLRWKSSVENITFR